MVKRNEFEKELIQLVYPAITNAQDILSKKYGIRFEIKMDWRITNGEFEDIKTGMGIGG